MKATTGSQIRRAIPVLIAVCLYSLTAYAKYSGGTGTPNDPYQIATAADLIALGETPGDYNKHFILTADIDLDPSLPGRTVFAEAVIAPAVPTNTNPYVQGTSFAGVFDGKGHTISNLTIEGQNYLGLFGLVGLGAEVKNLGVVDVNVIGSGHPIGGLVGDNLGTLTFCHSTGAVTGTSTRGGSIGGLVGNSMNYPATLTQCCSACAVTGTTGCVGGLAGFGGGTITQCYTTGAVSGNGEVGGLIGLNCADLTRCFSTGSVSGNSGVGGLVGYNVYGHVSQCYSTGGVTGNSSVGGLVGHSGNFGDGVVIQCYSTGAVTGNSNVGGLVGGNNGTVTRCYSSGAVSGTAGVGGLVGVNERYGKVSGSFWDTDTSDWITSAGGTGLTTAQTQRAQPIDPADGAYDVTQSTILGWFPAWQRPVGHDVYFGPDRDAVANATPESRAVYRGRQAADLTTYDPGPLGFGKTYYWRIDEVNEADPNSPWKGTVWSFTTADFIVAVVDDFESYTDRTGAWLPLVWLGGWGTGSWVGNFDTPLAEQVIVHGGRQSMPMLYFNDAEPWYSEAERTWETPQNWRINGAEALTLYFRGQVENSRDPLYLAIGDSAENAAVVAHPDPNAVLTTTWRKWQIPLADLRTAGVDPAAIKMMVIGVGDLNSRKPGGAGKIYIDDIRLTKRKP